MSLLVGLETAIRSIRTHTTALDTAEHNIANMNATGYSRQLANISATQPMNNPNGAGQIGTGSFISRIERIRDIYLDRQIRAELEKVGEWSILQRTYDTLKAIFTEVDDISGPGLQKQLTEFWNSWDTLSAKVDTDPSNTIAERMNVYSKAENLTKLLNSRAQALIDMQVDLNTEVRQALDEINGISKQIAELNKEIMNAQFLNQQPNDLMDKRDVALAKLAQLVNINVNNRTDGSVVVNIKGFTLISGGDAQQLTSNAATKDSKLENVAIFMGAARFNITTNIQSGVLGGLVKSRDEVVGWYRNQLDMLANTMITTFNRIHAAASLAGTAFFSGNRATDIGVNTELSNGNNITTTKDYQATATTTGTLNIARIFASLENKLMATWARSDKNVKYSMAIGATAFNATDGSIGMLGDGKIMINGVDVIYKAGESIGALVDRINNINPEKFIAFVGNVEKDANKQELFILSNDSLTIEEDDGRDFISNKPNRLSLMNEVISGAPVNYQGAIEGNYVRGKQPGPGFPAPQIFYTWDQEKNRIEVTPIQTSLGGNVSIVYRGNRYLNHWHTTDRISNTALGMLGSGMTNANYIEYNETAYDSWELQKFSYGAKATLTGGRYSVLPFYISDREGNMTQTMKLINNVRFEDFYSGTLSNLRSNFESSTNIRDEYLATVDSLQAMQDAITRVDENEELALAKKYQRAYDASVRLMAIIDQMMNMLINRTATSSSTDD